MFEAIDTAPPSRWRGIAIGLAIAVTAAGLIFGIGVPYLKGVLMGAMLSFDQRLRAEDAYMSSVCASMDYERDTSLCECVLAVEYPALDCHGPFLAWSLDRQVERCAVPELRDESVAFCSCVEQLDKLVEETSAEDERRKIVQRYEKCAELEAAPSLPTLEELAEPTNVQ